MALSAIQLPVLPTKMGCTVEWSFVEGACMRSDTATAIAGASVLHASCKDVHHAPVYLHGCGSGSTDLLEACHARTAMPVRH